jgi:hypothetical protein
VFGLTNKVTCNSGEIAESLAIRGAASYISSLTLDDYKIVSDCKAIVDIINNKASSKWMVAPIIADIRFFASRHSVSFIFVSRKNNRVAHWVASAAFKNSLSCNWFLDPPGDLKILLNND